MQRVHWVDTAKAILIALVVYGHFRGKYDGVVATHIIYAFHVPAFLFITGYLLPRDFRSKGASALWGRWLVVFIKAYLFFSALSLALWIGLVSPVPVSLAELPQLLGAILYGVDGPGNGLGHRNAPLWYFPFLASSLVFYWGATRLPAPWHLLALLAGVLLAYLYAGPRLPWCLELSGIGAVMLWAGQLLKQHETRLLDLARPTWAWIGVPVLAGMLFVQVKLNGRVNINNAILGQTPPLVITSALTGTLMVILLSMKLPATALARWISQHTLVIFAVHLFLILWLARVMPPLDSLPLRLGLLGGTTFAIVIVCAALSQATKPVLDRVMARHA